MTRDRFPICENEDEEDPDSDQNDNENETQAEDDMVQDEDDDQMDDEDDAKNIEHLSIKANCKHTSHRNFLIPVSRMTRRGGYSMLELI